MNIYLIIILSVIIIEFSLEQIVNYLNIKNLKKELPVEFKGMYDDEKYEKSQNYTRDTTKLSNVSSIFMIILTIPFILTGGFNYIDEIARNFGYGSIVTGLIFIGILMIGISLINLPLSIYSTFVLEAKYGFNKTDVKTFILDIIKSLILSIIIGTPILWTILWFFESTGELAWLYSWIGLFIFTIIMQFIAPVIIFPLFNKFSPLADGELKDAIDNYSKKTNFKISGIFTMDGSKRSTKLNAFFTGFGKNKRIVLFDTLIEKLSPGEIVSVLAHEMGHYKFKHILKMIATSTLTMGLMFYILSLFINNPGLFEAFKMQKLSIYASLIFFAFLYSPISIILSILGNIVSRKHEYQADRYAAETADSEMMISALKKLSLENLSNLTPHRLNVFLNYSHPPVLERIKAIKS